MLTDMRRFALAFLLLALAACTGDEPTTAPSPTPEATIEPTSEPTKDPPEEPAPGSCSDETVSGSPEVTITATDNTFSPDCVIVLAGQGLELLNDGANLHNFSVDGTDVSLDIPPGEATRTEAIGGAVPAGSYEFFCSYHRSAGMDGEITVTDVG
jgi:plastocyanin